MADALIGHSGFVGTTLQKQRGFDARFRSTDIDTIRGQSFSTLVCAGAPAQVWLANKEPEKDAAAIDALIGHLSQARAARVILISSVNVYHDYLHADEETAIDESKLPPYGRNRRRLERFVAEHFPKALIVRLPGLVGPSLRKNVVFDLLNDNNLHAVDARGQFQFYPMVNLWPDIETALAANLSLVNFAAEPVTVAEIARQGFGVEFTNTLASPPARYGMKTRHAALFGGEDGYAYSKKESLLAIRAYAQSEPKTPKSIM